MIVYWYVLSLTQNALSSKDCFMRISVDGLMGVGKSSLCRYLSQYGTMISEPRLGGFGIGFRSELEYLLARNSCWRDSTKAKITFYDRSVFTSSVFWLPEYCYQNLSFDELRLLMTTKESLLSSTPLPDLVVWLRAPVFTCSRRISERADFDEDTDIGYLCRLEASYIDEMEHLKSKGVKILTIDCEQDVYGLERQTFYENIYSQILNHLPIGHSC